MTEHGACGDGDRAATTCDMVGFTSVVGGRWKLAILCALTNDGPARFNQLIDRLAPITPTTLTRQLRELERDGLVIRTQFAEIPPRVEYEATHAAATLKPVLQTIAEWVHAHVDNRDAAQTQAATTAS